MKLRIAGCLVAVLVLAIAVFGQTTITPKLTRAEFQAQLQNVEQLTQEHVNALQVQIDAAQPQDREALNLQLMDLKKQGEIQRLNVLLQWAQNEGDAARIAEVQKALDQLIHPAQPQPVPQVERPIPGAVPPSSHTSSAN